MIKSVILGFLFGAGIGIFLPEAKAQTSYFNNQYGQPVGSAQQVGNTNYFSNQYGQPTGTAQQVGNTTYINNQYGQPVGSVQTPVQPPQPLQPYYIPPFPQLGR